MNRRNFIKIATLSVLPDSFINTHAQGVPGKPNIVHIYCDDLGYGDLGCFGNPVIRTPSLDKLAAEGMRLTDFYCPSPVCSPSRAGVMTGQTPNRTGVYDWIPENSGVCLTGNEVTVPQLLRSGGYTTCHSGKWHLISKWDGSEPTPGDHGFDYWFSTQNNAHPTHRNPDNFIRNGKPVGPLEGYSSTIIVDEAIRFIKQVYRQPQPFALFVWFHAPHEPIATAEKFMDWHPDVAESTRIEYFGNVSQMDYEVGRLMGALDELNLRDETLVMFSSDNGPETLKRHSQAFRSHGSPGPFRGMKLHMYEGGIRVPGIIRWPGKTHPGQVCHEPVCGVDILPTFSEIAGVNVPGDRPIDGTSILPIFKEKPLEREVPLYWQYDRAISNVKIAIREGAWKLLVDRELGAPELYNLEDDWRETKNRTFDERQRVRAMMKKLRQMHTDVQRFKSSKI